jgi:hypothetical protein
VARLLPGTAASSGVRYVTFVVERGSECFHTLPLPDWEHANVWHDVLLVPAERRSVFVNREGVVHLTGIDNFWA